MFPEFETKIIKIPWMIQFMSRSINKTEKQMTKTLHALYDGKVFRPEEPLDIKPNIRVRITIETTDVKTPKRRSFLQTARSLRVKGPADWSVRLEDYLYGEGTESP